MKTITLRIPTSFKEWKEFIREKSTSRKKHNQEVLWDFANAISCEALSNYWRNDISETMVKSVFRMGGNSKLTKMYFEAEKQLK